MPWRLMSAHVVSTLPLRRIQHTGSETAIRSERRFEGCGFVMPVARATGVPTPRSTTRAEIEFQSVKGLAKVRKRRQRSSAEVWVSGLRSAHALELLDESGAIEAEELRRGV